MKVMASSKDKNAQWPLMRLHREQAQTMFSMSFRFVGFDGTQWSAVNSRIDTSP
jgi:hypothetical protein